MACARFDPYRRNPGSGGLFPVRHVARRSGPKRAHLSGPCWRSGAGSRRARPRHWPRQASATTILSDGRRHRQAWVCRQPALPWSYCREFRHFSAAAPSFLRDGARHAGGFPHLRKESLVVYSTPWCDSMFAATNVIARFHGRACPRWS
jgi:hypothetical protein